MRSTVRTCIGCRRRAAASELVRLVLADGVLRAGQRASHPGRGASIHPSEACVVAAVRTHAFARAFRGAISPLQRGQGSADPNADDALRALINDIEVAHVLQQPRAGRTP